jgi:hypothetical protein
MKFHQSDCGDSIHSKLEQEASLALTVWRRMNHRLKMLQKNLYGFLKDKNHFSGAGWTGGDQQVTEGQASVVQECCFLNITSGQVSPRVTAYL